MTTRQLYEETPPLLAIIAAARTPSIYHRFIAFHKANPHVYAELARMAHDANAKGQNVGMRCLWEVLRWNVISEVVRIEGDEGPIYKLNDHFPPHYARMLMECEPGLEGFFEIRRIRA